MYDKEVLDDYIQQFERMGRAVVKGYRAPHKLVLLMAVCRLIEKGYIADNRIILNKKLEETFQTIWSELIDNKENLELDSVAEELFDNLKAKYPFKCNIANPYYYLNSEPFWNLVKTDNYEENKTWSISSLQRCFKYALLDNTLYGLMSNSDTQQIILGHLAYMTSLK